MSSQASQKFRTPYRHEASSTRYGSSSQSSCGETLGGLELDCPGDMLDLIRSQKSSQHQSTPAINKRRQMKIPKRQLFHEKNTPKPNITVPISVSKSKNELNNVHLPRHTLHPTYIHALTEDRMTKNLDPKPEISSSQVYDFPTSPTKTANTGICRKRRLVEKQVLKTIEKMAEEIQYFRLRKEELRREYPELCE